MTTWSRRVDSCRHRCRAHGLQLVSRIYAAEGPPSESDPGDQLFAVRPRGAPPGVNLYVGTIAKVALWLSRQSGRQLDELGDVPTPPSPARPLDPPETSSQPTLF